MKKLFILVVLTVLFIFSCGANMTLDNQTGAEHESGGDVYKWDISATLSGQAYGTIAAGSMMTKNIGNKLSVDSFKVEAFYKNGEKDTSVNYSSTESSLSGLSVNIENGDYTWYIGYGKAMTGQGTIVKK